MRRRRSRRATWEWAKSGSLVTADPGAGNGENAQSIIPVGRVKWLCDTRGRKQLSLVRLLLWLDLNIVPTGDASTHGTFPPWVDLYIIKATEDVEGNLSTDFEPFSEPEVPSAVANWDTDHPADGLDPFLWTTRIWTHTAIGALLTTPGAGVFQNNASAETAVTVGGQSFWDCQTPVMNPWQPQVDLRVRRSLKKNELLVIGMTFPTAGNTHSAVNLQWCTRMLCK